MMIDVMRFSLKLRRDKCNDAPVTDIQVRLGPLADPGAIRRNVSTLSQKKNRWGMAIFMRNRHKF